MGKRVMFGVLLAVMAATALAAVGYYEAAGTQDGTADAQTFGFAARQLRVYNDDTGADILHIRWHDSTAATTSDFGILAGEVYERHFPLDNGPGAVSLICSAADCPFRIEAIR